MVVVGAGPAGLLAAHFLARHHGCKVSVFDRRAHPGPIPIPPGDNDDDDRAFALAMNKRGGAAITAAVSCRWCTDWHAGCGTWPVQRHLLRVVVLCCATGYCSSCAPSLPGPTTLHCRAV